LTVLSNEDQDEEVEFVSDIEEDTSAKVSPTQHTSPTRESEALESLEFPSLEEHTVSAVNSEGSASSGICEEFNLGKTSIDSSLKPGIVGFGISEEHLGTASVDSSLTPVALDNDGKADGPSKSSIASFGEEGWSHAMNSPSDELSDLQDKDIKQSAAVSDSSKRSIKLSFTNSSGREESIYFDQVPSIAGACEETREKQPVGEECDSIAICEEHDSISIFQEHNTPIVFEEHARAEECDREASDSIIG